MSVDSSWELQKAIYGALTGDSALMAMITGVHDHVPQDTAYPYVTIGEGAARAAGSPNVRGSANNMHWACPNLYLADDPATVERKQGKKPVNS